MSQASDRSGVHLPKRKAQRLARLAPVLARSGFRAKRRRAFKFVRSCFRLVSGIAGSPVSGLGFKIQPGRLRGENLSADREGAGWSV
jgi:hypothetical protein